MKQRHKKQARRTAINGALMTGLDFMLFITLGTLLQFSPVLINFFSTGLTSLVSYRINKHWIFAGEREDMSDRRMITKFFAVTLFGLFVLQSLVIFFVTHEGWGAGQWLRDMLAGWGLGNYSTSAVTLIIAKLLAVGVSGISNFFGYKYIVFKADKSV